MSVWAHKLPQGITGHHINLSTRLDHDSTKQRKNRLVRQSDKKLRVIYMPSYNQMSGCKRFFGDNCINAYHVVVSIGRCKSAMSEYSSGVVYGFCNEHPISSSVLYMLIIRVCPPSPIGHNK